MAELKLKQPTIMRSANEVQRMHDILVGLIRGDVDTDLRDNAEVMLIVRETCSVLCWLLGHDHNTTFADNMVRIEQGLRDAGVEIEDAGYLSHWPGVD